ncbi:MULTISPECIES: c-type cytochrome [unclassified Shinella]|uniref:c-type cytochrome n=1 Tax=unclassified Shinella TaxID=2643062 RepID=UPI000AC2D881|nr:MULTISPECIES: cytochrome c [unclassified Shinella]MCO5151278.1 cytochrome c [Shinella sp.]MDC7265610.1 cytochrome c [Shinella sp. HY16]MDC7272507.1 cytochrome c [Shinella sp. YZ44]
MKAAWIAGGAVLAAVAGVVLFVLERPGREADARIALGKALYAENCASCHGVRLEGQPDWRSPRADGRLPAPPHDATGHTWHHADAQLLAIIRRGTAAVVGGGYESDMPGFAGILSDAESAAVLDFIKSTWPQREADYQRRISGG